MGVLAKFTYAGDKVGGKRKRRYIYTVQVANYNVM